jgi:hypothetical protein
MDKGWGDRGEEGEEGEREGGDNGGLRAYVLILENPQRT